MDWNWHGDCEPLAAANARYRCSSTKASEPPPEMHPQLATPPAIDRLESFLVGVFLRRYVTYCARRSRYAQMNGAVRLLRDLKPVAGGIESDDPSNSRIDSTE